MGIGREDLWRLLDEVPGPVVAPLLTAAYELELHREWSLGDRSPHGYAWATSFHASNFPGEDRLACGRKAVYDLLDPPSEGPHSPKLQAWFDLGLNLEHDWVRRLASYGVLLSADVTAGDRYQTGFHDDEHWLTGASDAIILKPGTRQSHCVEVKTTSDTKVRAILDSGGVDVPKQHAKYLRQAGAYVGLAHEAPFSPRVTICRKSGLIARMRMDLWPQMTDDVKSLMVCPAAMLVTDRPHVLLHDGVCDLEEIQVLPPDDGTLIYSSREEPLTVASFRVVYDPTFMAAGRARLAEWRRAFIDERIPEHPHEGKKAKWSVEPCAQCSLKAGVCKLDYQQRITDLSDSNLTTFAQGIAPLWDYDEKRKAVLDRWGLYANVG